MATESRGVRTWAYSAYRSVLTPYWHFTVFPMAYATVGAAVGQLTGTNWDWTLWGATLAVIFFGYEGINALDLADETIAVDMDSRVQSVLGVAQLLLSVALAAYVAAQTTWLFLGLLVVDIVFGVFYTLEWFGGRLHDRDYVTGWGNLGFCVGWIPTLLGYVLFTGRVSPGMALFAVGPLLHIGTLAWIEQDMKETHYDVLGIEHRRTDLESDTQRLKDRLVKLQMIHVLAFVAMAVGLLVELVL